MAGQLTIDTLKASSGVLATQNGMSGICKAWVNFNGSTAAIRSSFNVGSVTKNGTGSYTVNFTTAMPSADYAVNVSAKGANANTDYYASVGGSSQANPSTTACTMITLTASTQQDVSYAFMTVMGA